MTRNIAIILISANSLPLAQKIKEQYPSSVIYSRSANEDMTNIDSIESITRQLFAQKTDVLVFIGAMGICVRSIAPFIRDKHTDPAVICIDSTGQFVIPVLSGHIGGANELSKELSLLLGSNAIITTQSDNTGLWALDTLGDRFKWNAFMEDSNKQRKQTMNTSIATFVNRKPVALLLDIVDEGTRYLENTCPKHVDLFYKFSDIPTDKYELLITVSPFIYETSIPILCYCPQVLHLGVGCRKAMKGDPEDLLSRIMSEIKNNRIYRQAVADVSSIDLKKDEILLKGLATAISNHSLITYPAEVLNEISVPNPSPKVKEVTESYSVAEASAIQSAGGGYLVMEKTKGSLGQGAEYTIAIALDRKACHRGHIEIVGAGPGDPELISIRGRHMLEKADLILYAGSLVPKELTLCAKNGATVCSSADMNLEEQFALMKEFYDKSKLVVRLHTGDPCLYGAIQEQMNYFDQYNMSYHITPGISAFQAAAAALYSQFTIPEKVQTIILTRGEGRTPMPEKEQLHKLAASQSTMCIYLSAGIADKVQEELLQHYAPTTPIAACYKLTWKDERIYRGELKDLARIVKENNLTLTTLLVVGDAIDNRQGLSRLYADEFKHLFRK